MDYSYFSHKSSHSRWCSATNCRKSKGKYPALTFFSFPRDATRCKIWVENCRRLDLAGQDVSTLHKRGFVFCANHFETSQFMNAKQRNRLIWNAVPTLFDVPNPPPRIDVDPQTLSSKNTVVHQNSKGEALVTLDATKQLVENSENIVPSLGEKTASSTHSHLLHPSILEHDYGFRANPTVPGKPANTALSEVKGCSNNCNMIIKKLLEEIMALRKELHRRHPCTAPNDENLESSVSLSNTHRKNLEDESMENLLSESSELLESGQQENVNLKSVNCPNLKVGNINQKPSTGHYCSAYFRAEKLKCEKQEMRKRVRRQYVQILRLKKKVVDLKTKPLEKKNMKMEIRDLVDLSVKYLPEKCHPIFAAQLKHSLTKHPCDARWDQDVKDFSVALRCISRKAYAYCSKYFVLPRTRSVQRWTSEMHKSRALMDSEMDSIERVVRNASENSEQIDSMNQESANDSADPFVTGSCHPMDVCITTMEPSLLLQALTNQALTNQASTN